MSLKTRMLLVDVTTVVLILAGVTLLFVQVIDWLALPDLLLIPLLGMWMWSNVWSHRIKQDEDLLSYAPGRDPFA